jgi:hypothetical protein
MPSNPLPLERKHETIEERCVRLAERIEAYERDILGQTVLDLSEVRLALLDAANALRPHNY